MSDTALLPATDVLLQHTGFLRGLARSLVFDEGQAEDIVQDALIVALQSAPRHQGKLRAWLAGITRNLAFKRLRTEGRRRRREIAVARPKAVADTVDVAARIELQRRVIGAVAALPEPYRSTVVFRYLDELSVRDVAARMSVPPKTVETRLRRAVERLRRALDEHHAGSRRDWCLSLATLVPFSRELPAVALGTSTATLAGAAMSAKAATIGVAVAVAAGSFAAGWALRPASSDVQSRAPDRASNSAVLVSRADLERVQAELTSTRARYDAAQEELRALQSPAVPDQETPTEPVEAPRESGPRFVFEKFRGPLEEIDWTKAAESASEMPPLLADLGAGLAEGKALTAMGDLLGRIQRWNGPLMGETLRLQQAGVPGTGTNGVFTHPAVVVNMIFATLEKAGSPLSESQVEELRLIGDRYVLRDAERLASYPPDTIALRKTYGEALLKDDLFAAIDNLLADDQRAILHPPSVRGYVGLDLFSSGVLWSPLRRPVGFDTIDGLIEEGTRLQASSYGIEESALPVLRGLTAEWVGRFSKTFLSVEHSYDTIPKPTEIARVRECAKHLITLRESILAQVPLGEEAKERVRNDVMVAIPFRNPPKPAEKG